MKKPLDTDISYGGDNGYKDYYRFDSYDDDDSYGEDDDYDNEYKDYYRFKSYHDDDSDGEDDDYNEADDEPKLIRIHHALVQDNKDDFVRLINSWLSVKSELRTSKWIKDRIYCLDAAYCFIAIRSGKTKVSNIAACLGDSPLHEAAANGAYLIAVLKHLDTDITYGRENEYKDYYRFDSYYDDDSYGEDDVYIQADDEPKLIRIHHALVQDNKDDFVRLINSWLSVRSELRTSNWIKGRIYCLDAVDCFVAILAGETKVSSIAACLGDSPLHEAAYGAYKITAFLLENGFSANAKIRRDRRSSIKLPVDISLASSASERADAVEFILKLFGARWRERRTLEIVGLLAPKTREIKQVLFNNLKEANMIEVGALLLVAKSCVLSSSKAKGEFRSISEMHDFLLDELNSFKGNKKSINISYRCQLNRMEQTLLLLKILERIGDKIATLLQLNCWTFSVILAAVSLIRDAGFDVKADYEYHQFENKWSRSAQLRCDVLKRVTDDRKNTTSTTYALPSLPKAAALSVGSVRKFGSTSRLPYLSEALRKSNHVSTSLIANNLSLNGLLKQSVPFLGTLKKVFKRGLHA